MERPQDSDAFNRIYNSLGALALIGTELTIPLKAADEQPPYEQMRTGIASNGYEVIQEAPAPFTHVLQVDFRHIEKTLPVYYFAEIKSGK